MHVIDETLREPLAQLWTEETKCHRKYFLKQHTEYSTQATLLSKGPSINVNIFMSVQTIHFLRPLPPPPKKEYTSTFLSAKNPHENNKNQAKKLKVYGTNVDFHRPPPPSPTKVYGLYTCENVNIYGWPLSTLTNWL